MLEESTDGSSDQPRLWFRNQGLFSDHYLKARLPQLKAWETGEELAAFRRALVSLYNSKKTPLPNMNEAQTEDEFIKPVLDTLGYADSYIVQAPTKIGKRANRPDYAFFPDKATKDMAYRSSKDVDYTNCIGIADAKYWERELDLARTSDRDTFTNQNPSFQMAGYLVGTKRDWGILTNGRLWRLYSAKSHLPLGNYYQIDLVELLTDWPPESLKYFYLFFRKEALIPVDGRSFLDSVFEGSNEYAVELEADIKERAYEVVETLCHGFALGFPIEGLTSSALQGIYDNSLTLLYRLLFVFYAEARGLLPLATNRTYRDQYSMHSLTREIDDIMAKGHQLSPKSTIYYQRMGSLFKLIDAGDLVLGVPEYNGGLFNSGEHPFLEAQAIPDSFLVRAIHQLARIPDKKLGRVVAVDYNALSERHLGSIYEGLLEFKPRIALSDLVAVNEKSGTKYVPAEKYPEKKIAYKRHDLYLANDCGERKTSGSYYTPEYIVDFIVENTLDPLVAEAQGLVKNLKPQVDSEIARWQKLKGQKQNLEPTAKYDRKIAEERERLLEPYLSLKVLDPAMGSGHFLSRATDFLAEAIATDPCIERNVELTEESELTYYRRRVVENCIYGVDLNPLAVELAKLTLWLATMAKSKPLSFLNHHLKMGNSLIGAKIADLDEIPKVPGKKKRLDLSRAPKQIGQFEWIFDNKIALLLESRALIAQLPTETLKDIRQKENWESGFQQNAERFRLLADIWASTYFGNAVRWDTYNRLLDNIQLDDTEWENLIQDKRIEAARAIRREKHFFHWELEFPEVFYERDGKRKPEPGFDAVIGNPPYDVVKEDAFNHLSVAAGCGNLAGHFVARGADMVRDRGSFGMVLPLSIACGSDFESLRRYLYGRFGLLRATHYSIRPAKLFPQVDQRITILIALSCGNHPCLVESSRLYRFREGAQANVVLNARVGSGGIVKEGYIPRVGDDTGAGIYKRLGDITTSLKDYCSHAAEVQGVSLWFHSVGRYWLKAYDFMPYFARDGKRAVSADLAEIRLRCPEAAKAAVGIINSSLFYFWWMLQCDEFHLLRSQVTSFPFPPSLLEDKRLRGAATRLMEDYQRKAVRKQIHAGGSKIEMDEIHARLSRDCIRGIDKILAVHYNLTKKEISYLDTYDEEFRASEE
ncbi:MAG: hypothetical protein A2Z75_04165 [Chloroflexi bacterium RBG_13_50_10]|nr:MAG: hypothetical protein A2Z75_04165 [Chloroflexi bacterium RBG_13_50_10]